MSICLSQVIQNNFITGLQENKKYWWGAFFSPHQKLYPLTLHHLTHLMGKTTIRQHGCTFLHSAFPLCYPLFVTLSFLQIPLVHSPLLMSNLLCSLHPPVFKVCATALWVTVTSSVTQPLNLSWALWFEITLHRIQRLWFFLKLLMNSGKIPYYTLSLCAAVKMKLFHVA